MSLFKKTVFQALIDKATKSRAFLERKNNIIEKLVELCTGQLIERGQLQRVQTIAETMYTMYADTFYALKSKVQKASASMTDAEKMAVSQEMAAICQEITRLNSTMDKIIID